VIRTAMRHTGEGYEGGATLDFPLPDDARLDVPATHRFVAPDELKTLVQHSAQIKVEARTLLACLQTLL